MEQGTILVVDDQDAELVAEMLRPLGYWVHTARDSYEGTVKMRETKPDLVILDMQMPAGGGMDLFERLRWGGADKPVIFISGLPGAAQMVEQRAVPKARFIPKPIEAGALAAAVRGLLRV